MKSLKRRTGNRGALERNSQSREREGGVKQGKGKKFPEKGRRGERIERDLVTGYGGSAHLILLTSGGIKHARGGRGGVSNSID